MFGRMKAPELDISSVWKDVSRLAKHDIIGFHTHFEVTEIFAVFEHKGAAHNVFSVLVADERDDALLPKPRYIGGKVNLKSYKDVMFGIKRTFIKISELEEAIDRLKTTGEWRLSDDRLHTGKLVPINPLFVPSDSTESAPLNNVLKNNFWNGSHIIEMMDLSKDTLRPLIDVPLRLQELSEAIQKHVPIRLASLSDRLGNIIVQIPVTVMMAAFAKNRPNGDTTVTVRWHPKASVRALRASVEMRYDNIVTTHASADLSQLQQNLATLDGDGVQHTAIWDDHHEVLLARSSATSFIQTIGLGMNMLGGEPRVFKARDENGEEKPVRINLIKASQNEIKAPTADRGRSWIQRRIYREEASRLIAQRRFIAYKPMPGQENEMHRRAIGDVRALITQHGRGGAWLWDPYLSANDVLRTLFYSPYAGADLRALTAGYEPPSGVRSKPTFASIWRQIVWLMKDRFWKKAPPEPSFADRQRNAFASANSNLEGLRLAYRMKSGSSGWSFHDRFLIFPDAGHGPRAWSLGTSVNALGRQHHILQEVDDSRHVVDAFLELWDQLEQPEHLIWKVP